MVDKNRIIGALKEVLDPEMKMDVWSLNLIRDIKVTEDSVRIKMTLTSPACPYGPLLVNQVRESVAGLDGVKSVDIDLVFDPPWEPPEELKAMFGLGEKEDSEE